MSRYNQKWQLRPGSTSGWSPRRGEWEGVRTPNRQDEVLHNHKQGPGIFVYMGLSETAPHYHLFRCMQMSDPPRRVVALVPFNQRYFSEDSKARQGGCSMRKCPGDAIAMNAKGRQAYCALHAAKYTAERQPCPYTSIFPCVEQMNLNQGLTAELHVHCSICRTERDLECECSYEEV